MHFTPIDFIRESNRIEGIHREPTESEIVEYHRFMDLKEVTIEDLQYFVKVYQSDAVLRDRTGFDVQVGSYFPPRGDITIKTRLMDILNDAEAGRGHDGRRAHVIHRRYESLHPFTDGNGRSGRMLWMWMMKKAPLGFLHHWYYQSLEHF